ncbi:hypothetical protein C8R43DRAFT_1123379 [Mycena crocata]|nr:hypothetical protein C8R43DRAFT_1123379 [Mycena crocata]
MPPRLEKPTCSRCKNRKIRCDGDHPSQCSACSATGAKCEYEGYLTVTAELRKGAACLSCRRKKRRCDGRMPCDTCQRGRKKTRCEYPEGAIGTLLPFPDQNLATASISLQNSTPPITPNYTAKISRPFPQAESIQSEGITRIRKLFLDHRFQLGFSVSDDTLSALSRGHIGPALQPAVLHACQLIGHMLARHLQSNTWLSLPGHSEDESEQARLALSSLQTPLAHVQASTLLASYFFNKGIHVGAREILRSADKVVWLGLSPATPAAEAQAVLSHLVYLDVSYSLILNLPKVLDTRLYTAFKSLIQLPSPDAEINFIRAKSIVLLSEAKELSEEWYRAQLDDAGNTAWQEKYWELMEALDAQRAFIASTLIRTAFVPTLKTMSLSLKVCAIIVLTGLTILLELFASDKNELRRKKYEAVCEIIGISGMFSAEDAEYLDPILSTCWRIIIAPLNADIALGAAAPIPPECIDKLPVMANIIRTQNVTLQRVLPFAVSV